MTKLEPVRVGFFVAIVSFKPRSVRKSQMGLLKPVLWLAAGAKGW